MTTLGKTVFLILSLAALVTVTLAYRGESAAPTPPPAQLTATQRAEMQPAPVTPAMATPAAPAATQDDVEPPDPEFEDGNGS